MIGSFSRSLGFCIGINEYGCGFQSSRRRSLMRALAEGGNVAAALQTYDGLSSLLREELGVSPSPPTQELHAQLLKMT